MKSLFVLSTLVLGLGSSVAQAADLRTELRNLAQPLVRTTTREIHVYHWAPKKSIVGANDPRPIAARDARVRDYLLYLKELFWTPVKHGGMAGNGVYVSTDPIATSAYGGVHDFSIDKDWTLVQMVMPAGTRFIHLRNLVMFSKPVETLMKTAGCNAMDLEGLFESDYQPKCRQIRNELVWDLDLMALYYGYSASDFREMCSTPQNQRTNGAFVLFDDRSINMPRMVSLTADIPAQDQHGELRLIIRGLFEQFYKAYNYSSTDTLIPWPSLKGQRPRTDVQAWARHTLFGCGGWSEDL